MLSSTERSGKNLFWSIKNSGEIVDKLKARDFNATSLSTYDFSTLYTIVTGVTCSLYQDAHRQQTASPVK